MIGYVKSAQATVGTTVTSISLSYTIAVGDFVVVEYDTYLAVTGNPGAISDDGGNVYTPRVSSAPSAGTGSYVYTTVATAAATTITIALTGTQNTNGNTIIARTYSNVGSVGVTGTNSSTTGVTSASITGTLGSANSWMAASFAVRGGTNFAATSGIIRQGIIVGSPSSRGLSLDNTGTVSPVCSISWTSASQFAATFVELIPKPLPNLSAISPTTGTQGTTVPVTLTGTSLTGTAAISVTGGGVTVSNLVVVNDTTVTASFAIASAATPGTVSVSLATPVGPSNTLSFNIQLPAPVLGAITPNTGTQGLTVPVTISGTNLTGATAVNAGAGITVSNLVVVNSTTLTANFAIASNAVAGSNNVTVVTPSGTSNPVGFTIQSAATAPALSSITPGSGSQATTVAVTLTGMNLSGATAINLSGTGITVSNLVVVNATTITATFQIASAVGSQNVTVVTPGGTSNPVSFSVVFSFLVSGMSWVTLVRP